MKKEYIILIILIIGLSAYLALKKEGRVHYELPAVPGVDTARIDRIEISKADRLVVLNKEENSWTVTDKKFPANPDDVTQILDTLKQIKLSALVSEAKDLARYALDDPHAVKVKAMAKDEVVRSLVIGKPAPSHNHTFICLDDKNPAVYQANGNFQSQFDKEAALFRDKKVLEFDPDKTKKITLEKQGTTVTFVKTSIPEKQPPEKSNQEKSNQEKDDTPKPQTAENTAPREAVWTTQDGSSADQKTVSELLSSLSTLECQAFMNDDKAARLKQIAPSCKILLENDQTFVLNLFNENDNQEIEGSCSYTPYAFTLPGYKADDIVSYADKLLGIEPQQDNTKPE